MIAGERRWRAAKRAGLTEIPAIVREADDVTAAQLALVENIQREDLDPIERSDALVELRDRFGLTQQDIAREIGLDRSSVANLMRLGELEEALRGLVRDNFLTMGHAKVLLGMGGGSARVEIGQLAAEQGWSVRKLESRVKGLGREIGAQSKDLSPAHAAQHRVIETRIGEQLGTKARLSTDSSGKRGRLSIEFYDLDHFEGLLKRLGIDLGDQL